MNQKNLAAMLTEPKNQSSASKLGAEGLIGTGKGFKKGWKGMEDFGKKRGVERDEKKKRQAEEKELKKELKEERGRFERERKEKISGSEAGGNARFGTGSNIVTSPAEFSASSRDAILSMDGSNSMLNFKKTIEPSRDSSRASLSANALQGPNPISSSIPLFQFQDQPTVASITCKSLDRDLELLDHSQEAQIGFNSLATSSFSPWPGLLITNLTLVSRGGDVELRKQNQYSQLESRGDSQEDSKADDLMEERQEVGQSEINGPSQTNYEEASPAAGGSSFSTADGRSSSRPLPPPPSNALTQASKSSTLNLGSVPLQPATSRVSDTIPSNDFKGSQTRTTKSWPQSQVARAEVPSVTDTTDSKQARSESASKWAGKLKTVGKGIHDMI